jgi:dipeptidyl aminopeptidase/acylaminoacyl peptidase
VVVLAVTMSAALAAQAPLASDPCAAFADDNPHGEAGRPVGVRDLATIADIGQASPHDLPSSPFGVSPDGRSIAFVVRRANPETNSYCQRLLVTSLQHPGAARELDRGGEFIRMLTAVRKFAAVESGVADVISPRWSPDGQAVAYAKQIGGQVQIWTAAASGGPAVQATNLDFRPENFAWAADGRGFLVAGRPAIAAEKARIDAEGRKGWLYDGRIAPFVSIRPQVRGTFPMEYFHVDARTGQRRPARPDEIARVDPEADPGKPALAGLFAAGNSGNRAWTEAKSPDKLLSPRRLVVRWRDGTSSVCDDDICATIRRLGWSDDGATIFFLARQGWAKSVTSVFQWQMGDPRPRELLATEDVLVGCELHGSDLICARESSSRPRRLVAIDLADGKERVIFDPNPLFARLQLGEVRRLRYTTSFGTEAFADLVLPPDSRSGDKHPLVVVQYNSEGFLRGGTGDEVPVHVLAGRGIAVLSFERPFGAPGTEEAKTELEYRQLVRRNWFDRRNVQSAIEKAITGAVATGRIDPDRLGISGFSEGTSATQWALINSRLFKVAALGICCEDKVAIAMNGGIDYETFLREMGQPLYSYEKEDYWAPLSLMQNAERIEAPILVQSGEYLLGLDVLAAFRRLGKVMELHVFDNEPHIKFQPQHRFAMYDRVVDWFAFWLKAERDCDAKKSSQYERWLAMPGAPSALLCAGRSALTP